MTIKFKLSLLISVVCVVSILTLGGVLFFLSQGKEQSTIINILGRQRMLSQAMAKSALGIGGNKIHMAQLKSQTMLIDNYITMMRGTYTQYVVGTAKKSGLGLTMHPDKDASSVPFSATLTRLVNEEFKKKLVEINIHYELDILAEKPLNPSQGLKTTEDREANDFLLKNKDQVYSFGKEEASGVYQYFYTADRAVAQGCADCHNTMGGHSFQRGDVLGIRKFRVRVSSSLEAGRKILNPNTEEYTASSTAFTQTLEAAEKGGKFPLDLSLKNFGEIKALEDTESLALIPNIHKVYDLFAKQANILISDVKDDQDLDLVRGQVLELSNQVRKLSNGLVQQYTSFADQGNQLLRTMSWVGLIIVILFFLVSQIIVIPSITKVLAKTTEVFNSMFKEGQTDLSKRLNQQGHDEFSVMGQVFNKLMDQVQNVIKDLKSNVSILTKSSKELLQGSEIMVVKIDTMKIKSTSVASSTEEMSTNINNIATAAEEMSANINSVSSVAEEMSASMGTVFTTVQAFNVSIKNISDNSQEAMDVSNSAILMSKEANDTMDTLGKSANGIGNVTEVIKKIAEQTNLLALNATIEAASAGEAGKGFAVVANEIKELAGQSAAAAQDISTRIDGIQDSVTTAIKVINRVTTVIQKIGGSVAVINEAVGKQNQDAQDISANIQETNGGVSNIASAMGEIASGANDMAKNASEAAKGVREVVMSIGEVDTIVHESQSEMKRLTNSSQDVGKVTVGTESMIAQFIVN